MSGNEWTYERGSELPSFALDWYDSDGNLLDLSSDTLALELVTDDADETSTVTKSSGLTGSATSPNFLAAWSSGELDITEGRYRVKCKATASGADRFFSPYRWPIIVII